MIAINKAEREIISQRLPNVHIVRTMKQKSKRHRYYCEETKQVLRLLRQIREADHTAELYWKEVQNADRKNANRI